MFAVGPLLTGIAYVAVSVIYVARIEHELSAENPDRVPPGTWPLLLCEALVWPFALIVDFVSGFKVRRRNKASAVARGHLVARAIIETYVGEHVGTVQPLDAVDQARLGALLHDALTAGDPYAPTSTEFLAGFVAEVNAFDELQRASDRSRDEAPFRSEPAAVALDTTLEVAHS